MGERAEDARRETESVRRETENMGRELEIKLEKVGRRIEDNGRDIESMKHDVAKVERDVEELKYIFGMVAKLPSLDPGLEKMRLNRLLAERRASPRSHRESRPKRLRLGTPSWGRSRRSRQRRARHFRQHEHSETHSDSQS